MHTSVFGPKIWDDLYVRHNCPLYLKLVKYADGHCAFSMELSVSPELTAF